MDIKKITENLKTQKILPYSKEIIKKLNINKSWFPDSETFMNSFNKKMGIMNINSLITYESNSIIKGYDQYACRIEVKGRGAVILPIEKKENDIYFYLIPQYRLQPDLKTQEYYFPKFEAVLKSNKTDNEIISYLFPLITEFFYKIGRVSFEVPRGYSNGENSEITAIRELQEETGFIVKSLVKIGEECSNSTWDKYTFDSFVCEIEKKSNSNIEESESIGKSQKFNLKDINQLIENNLLYCSITKSVLFSYISKYS